MELEEEIKFYISEKIALSDDPIRIINEILCCLVELEIIYMDREE